MIRTLIATGRKDVSKHFTISPFFDDGALKLKLSIKPSLSSEKRYEKHYAGCEVFIRCADRYKAQTIKAGRLEKLMGKTGEYVFEDFSQEHDPKIQVRIVNPDTKQIQADTRPHDLPGSGKDKGKRSLIIVRECEVPKHELYKVEWPDESPRPIMYLNNREHGSIKSTLLRDAAFWPIIKPAVLRSVLNIIFTEGLHLEKNAKGTRFPLSGCSSASTSGGTLIRPPPEAPTPLPCKTTGSTNPSITSPGRSSFPANGPLKNNNAPS
jgi:hypothetical protein